MEETLEAFRQSAGAMNVIISDCNGVQLCGAGESIEGLELFSAVFQNARDQLARLVEVSQIITEYATFFLIQVGQGDIHISLQVEKSVPLSKALYNLQHLDISSLVKAFADFQN
jgi:hypothetical protein